MGNNDIEQFRQQWQDVIAKTEEIKSTFNNELAPTLEKFGGGISKKVKKIAGTIGLVAGIVSIVLSFIAGPLGISAAAATAVTNVLGTTTAISGAAGTIAHTSSARRAFARGDKKTAWKNVGSAALNALSGILGAGRLSFNSPEVIQASKIARGWFGAAGMGTTAAMKGSSAYKKYKNPETRHEAWKDFAWAVLSTVAATMSAANAIHATNDFNDMMDSNDPNNAIRNADMEKARQMQSRYASPYDSEKNDAIRNADARVEDEMRQRYALSDEERASRANEAIRKADEETTKMHAAMTNRTGENTEGFEATGFDGKTKDVITSIDENGGQETSVVDKDSGNSELDIYNGPEGKQIPNTIDAVRKAHVGDWLIRNDGTKVHITSGDIIWANNQQISPENEMIQFPGPMCDKEFNGKEELVWELISSEDTLPNFNNATNNLTNYHGLTSPSAGPFGPKGWRLNPLINNSVNTDQQSNIYFPNNTSKNDSIGALLNDPETKAQIAANVAERQNARAANVAEIQNALRSKGML